MFEPASLRVLVAPAAEPISTSLAMQHTRIDASGDEALIGGYITAARMWAEKFLNRALITQTLRSVFTLVGEPRPFMLQPFGMSGGMWPGFGSNYPGSRRSAIELPRPPVQAITGLALLDGTDQTTALAATTASATTGETALQFAAIGFAGSLRGLYATDLTTPGAIEAGTIAVSATVASGVVTVTLSRPLAGNSPIGDLILFSAASATTFAPVPQFWIADLGVEPARLRVNWPAIADLRTVTRPLWHIEADYVAGYGTAADIPQPIIHAILMLTAWLYERRGDDGGEMPEFVRSLLWDYRVTSFGV